MGQTNCPSCGSENLSLDDASGKWDGAEYYHEWSCVSCGADIVESFSSDGLSKK